MAAVFPDQPVLGRASRLLLDEIETILAEKHVFEGPRPENPPVDGDTLIGLLMAPATPPPPPGPSKFGEGDSVRVRRFSPTGHTRCPRYLRGAPGRIA